MSNTSKGRATKGSKFWVQTIINSEMKQRLDKQIGLGEIEWLSPLKSEDYAEYSLNQEEIKTKLSLDNADFSFWPHRQPQWDAIGKAGDKIILVEAKAHTSETKSTLSATSKSSIYFITESMKKAFNAYGGKGDFPSWAERYYQFANRLTFLHFLKKQGISAVVVFVNIVNDPTYIAENLQVWESESRKLYQEMLGQSVLPEDAVDIYFEV
jgi:hypothetical protein